MTDTTDLTSEDLRESVEGGVSPHLLAMTAPTFELTIEAFAYEYGRLARTAKDAMDDGEDADYWKGRLDAYATVRGELVSALLRHDKIDRYPFTDDELADLVDAKDDEITDLVDEE